MIFSFSVSTQDFIKVKQKIQKYPGLKFEYNPVEFKGSVNIKISGHVTEMNEIVKYLGIINNVKINSL